MPDEKVPLRRPTRQPHPRGTAAGAGTHFDCVANANYVLDELMEVVESLSKFPVGGSYPKELVGLGIKEYRQTFFKPYRVIYRVTGSQVIIYLIADGRRHMQSVLARRLLGA